MIVNAPAGMKTREDAVKENDLQAVASGCLFPEGPVAMADGSVLFVEIEGQTLSRLTPDNEVERLLDLPGGPNGLAIGPDGAAYVCNNGGVYNFIKLSADPRITIPDPGGPPADFRGGRIQRIDLETHEVTDLYEDYLLDGVRKDLLSPDDIVFDAAGGFYFTDCGAQYEDRIMKGGVFYGTIHGDPLKLVAQIPTANGIGLSKDGGTLYVADTIFARLWKVHIPDPVGKPGVAAPGPVPGSPGEVVMTLPGYQFVDSLKLEACGNVCVATIGLPEGGITIHHADGSGTERVPVPDPFVTNLCFGVADPQDVWITASGTGMIYKGRWDRPGMPMAFTA